MAREPGVLTVVRELLGDAADERFSGRRVERLPVTSGDAAARRLRGRTDGGTDVAVDLERGAYLRHGAVLLDDGETIVVVDRVPEEALVVRLDGTLPAAELVRQAALLGHAFGNQHVSLEVHDGAIVAPVTTSRDVVTRTLEGLALRGGAFEFRQLRLACEHPGHGGSHRH